MIFRTQSRLSLDSSRVGEAGDNETVLALQALLGPRAALLPSELLALLQMTGLSLQDERLGSEVAYLESLAPDKELSLDDVLRLVRHNLLLEMAVCGNLVIRDFQWTLEALDSVYEEAKQALAALPEAARGQVCPAPPKLARVSADKSAASFCSISGQRWSRGDSLEMHAVEQCSSCLLYLTALTELGDEAVHARVGREAAPSSRGLELDVRNRPFNAMCDAGIIMGAALVLGSGGETVTADRFSFVKSVWAAATGRHDVDFDNSHFLSHRAASSRTFAIGYLLNHAKSFGSDKRREELEAILGFSQMNLSIEVSCEDMAVFAGTLAAGGVCPTTNRRVWPADHVRSCLSMMSSCGTGDHSGITAFTVGFPCKSSSSGWLICVVPNLGGWATFQPRLDENDNSVLGLLAARLLVARLPLHSFDSSVAKDSAVFTELMTGRRAAARAAAAKRGRENETVEIFLAAAEGRANYIRRLSARGVDVNVADYDERSPLHVAASCGHLACVKVLVLLGADLEARDRMGSTALQDAEAEGFPAIADWLRAAAASQAKDAASTGAAASQHLQDRDDLATTDGAGSEDGAAFRSYDGGDQGSEDGGVIPPSPGTGASVGRAREEGQQHEQPPPSPQEQQQQQQQQQQPKGLAQHMGAFRDDISGGAAPNGSASGVGDSLAPALTLQQLRRWLASMRDLETGAVPTEADLATFMSSQGIDLEKIELLYSLRGESQSRSTAAAMQMLNERRLSSLKSPGRSPRRLKSPVHDLARRTTSKLSSVSASSSEVNSGRLGSAYASDDDAVSPIASPRPNGHGGPATPATPAAASFTQQHQQQGKQQQQQQQHTFRKAASDAPYDAAAVVAAAAATAAAGAAASADAAKRPVTAERLRELAIKYPCVTSFMEGRPAVVDFAGFKHVLGQIFVRASSNCDGHVATYIPQLGKVNPEQFGLSVCSVDAQQVSFGDSDVKFCLQSVSKTVNYCIAQELIGEDEVHKHIGYEPSGLNFNELRLNKEGKPFNPLINAGAILCCSLIQPEASAEERFDYLTGVWTRLSGGVTPSFNNETFLGEQATADRNVTLAYMMKEKRAFPDAVNKSANALTEVLGFYFSCCSLELSCEPLSVCAATLANGGVNPFTQERVFSERTVRNCLSVCAVAGMYDYSGEFLYSIGVPCKSGVSGALLLVVPSVMGIAIWSPRLDRLGNSARGIEFCRLLTEHFAVHRYSMLRGGARRHMCRDLRDFSAGCENARITARLIEAATRGDTKSLRLLLAEGEVELDRGDYDGRRALHLAASCGYLKFVRTLVEQGADVNPIDRWGSTPLDDAKRSAHQLIVDFLHEKGARHGPQQRVRRQVQTIKEDAAE
jgi:glutaminase